MNGTTTRTRLATIAVIAGFGLAACTTLEDSPPPVVLRSVTEAVARIEPVGDSGVSGTVTFRKEGSEIRVPADITGLKPGKHGFHVHQYGDLSTDDALSTGLHYNPYNQPHGGPDSSQRHLGDLGNLVADRTGHAEFSRIDTRIVLNGPASIVGRSVVIKAREDDFRTQPDGGAGDAVGYGIIGITAVADTPTYR